MRPCTGPTLLESFRQSAAQMQTVPRIKPWNLTDMAYEVGAVRPGVGVNDGVTPLSNAALRASPGTMTTRWSNGHWSGPWE